MTEYHLHVNALALSELSKTNLLGCGLASKPFLIGAQGASYTPLFHFNFKTINVDEFNYTFDSCRLILGGDQGFVGYVEGEYVSGAFAVEDSSDLDGNSNDFPMLRLKQADKWREAEVHVSIRSPALADELRRKNFYISRIVKEGVEWEVATAQGETRVVRALYEHLVSRADESKMCVRIKMETLLKLYVSPGFNWLPPQITGFESKYP